MGWFWADTPTTAPIGAIAPHPISSADGVPPPSCPMHKSSSAQSPFRKPSTSTPPPSKSCPYAPPTGPSSPASSALVSEQSQRSDNGSWMSRINPLNLMPSLPNAPTSSSQTFSLPLTREASSIPRGSSSRSPSPSGRGCPVKHSPTSSSASGAAATSSDDSAYADDGSDKWQYPSPQQMYNALLRKGYTDTDPTAVPAMVSVHNFLNEGAWAEILEWERRFHAGLRSGWEISSRGEENSYFGAMTELEAEGWRKAMQSMQRWQDVQAQLDGKRNASDNSRLGEVPEPRLLRFEGRPDERTPRAQWLQFLGRVWPSQYSSAPPFDRHDWYVLRHMPDGTTREVRYVIDYYSGPNEQTGEPVFYLDVRPAIDGPTGFGERVLRWGGDAWWRASGGAVREKNEFEKKIQEARERMEKEGRR